VAVLVLSQYVEPGCAMKLLADSADGVGYLLKDRISDVPGVPGGRAAGGARRLGRRPDDRLDAAVQRRLDDPLQRLTPRSGRCWS
jgi:hypothetical protein